MLRGAVAVLGLTFTVACGGLGGGTGAPIPVVAPPVIVTQPQSPTVQAGHYASLSVVATGEKLTYTWRKNGLPIPGLSSASIYTFMASQEDDGAVYSVVVSNPGGSVTSQNAVLTVSLPLTDLIHNGSFESQSGGNAAFWTFSDANMTITYADFGIQPPTGAGTYFAVNGYWGDIKNDSVYQTVTIPASATQADLALVQTVANLFTATPGVVYNTYRIKVQDNTGNDLQTLATRTDQDSNVVNGQPVWTAMSFNLLAYKGMTIRIAFESSQTDASKNTLFGTDLVSLKVK
jgi:hypothetical protein